METRVVVGLTQSVCGCPAQVSSALGRCKIAGGRQSRSPDTSGSTESSSSFHEDPEGVKAFERERRLKLDEAARV